MGEIIQKPSIHPFVAVQTDNLSIYLWISFKFCIHTTEAEVTDFIIVHWDTWREGELGEGAGNFLHVYMV